MIGSVTGPLFHVIMSSASTEGFSLDLHTVMPWLPSRLLHGVVESLSLASRHISCVLLLYPQVCCGSFLVCSRRCRYYVHSSSSSTHMVRRGKGGCDTGI